MGSADVGRQSAAVWYATTRLLQDIPGFGPSPPAQQCVGGFFFSEAAMSVEDELAYLRYKVQRLRDQAAYERTRAA